MRKDELKTLELPDEMKAAISSILPNENITNNANIQIGKTNFNNVKEVNVVTQSTNNQLNAAIDGYIEDFSNDFYNLIITNTELLNEDCITIKIPYSTALKTDYGTHAEIYNMFKNPSKETQKRIKDFPTLVIDKNASDSKVNTTFAIVCKITKLKYEQDGTVNFTLVKIKKETYTKEYIISNASSLDIKLSNGVTELDEVHWAIKNKDLKTLLKLEGGI